MKRLRRIFKVSPTRISKFFGLFVLNLFVFGCVYSEDNISTDIAPMKISKGALNINTASAKEFERLPNIGPKISLRIVVHREKFGKFRRVEHILLVDGISETRFRKIRSFIKIE